MFNESPVVGNLKAATAALEVIVVVAAAKILEPKALIVSLIALLIVNLGKVGEIVTLASNACVAAVVHKYTIPYGATVAVLPTRS
jgi:hypothetical protein